MTRLIFAILAVAFVVGCGSTSSTDFGDQAEKTLEMFNPDAGKSFASTYLHESKPLNAEFIGVPFLFDGATILLGDFDLVAWRNKRFLTVEGREFIPQDRYLIDMRSGKIRHLNIQEGELQFKSLLQSLVIKLSPLKDVDGTPNFLVLTNMVEKGGKASVLVIEDPVTTKVHGFIESAIVNARFSRSLFSVDK